MGWGGCLKKMSTTSLILIVISLDVDLNSLGAFSYTHFDKYSPKFHRVIDHELMGIKMMYGM